MKPKLCPECGAYIYARKDGACTVCNQPLLYINGKYLSPRQQADSKAIYELWKEAARKSGLIIYHQRFSHAHFAELKLAKALVGNAAEYLRRANYAEINAQQFAEEYICYIMAQPFVIRLTYENQSLVIIANGLFWKHAAGILDSIKQKKREEVNQRLAGSTGFSVPSLCMG